MKNTIASIRTQVRWITLGLVVLTGCAPTPILPPTSVLCENTAGLRKVKRIGLVVIEMKEPLIVQLYVQPRPYDAITSDALRILSQTQKTLTSTLKDFLTEKGYSVEEIRSGTEAVEIHEDQSKNIDAICVVRFWYDFRPGKMLRYSIHLKGSVVSAIPDKPLLRFESAGFHDFSPKRTHYRLVPGLRLDDILEESSSAQVCTWDFIVIGLRLDTVYDFYPDDLTNAQSQVVGKIRDSLARSWPADANRR